MAVAKATVEKVSCNALRHPIRVRILEVMCDGDLSPVRFVDLGLLPPGVKPFKSRQQLLSHVAYHFRVLADEGCVFVIEENPRRGATEHVYRSRAFALHTDEEFAQLTLEERREISRSTFQMLIARADGALMHGTFDARPDRHLSWLSMLLDEEAWKDLRDLQAETLERAQGIKAAAIARAEERSEKGEDAETFLATFGALAFESPPNPYAGLTTGTGDPAA